jgi:hypothetical protein
MKAYTTDGLEIECGGYKAVRAGGVVLTSDKKRKHVVGYVPAAQLRYILPDDVRPEADRDAEGGAETAERASTVGEESTDEADESVDEQAAESTAGDDDSAIEFTSETAVTPTGDGGASDAAEPEESVTVAAVATDEIGVVSVPSDRRADSHVHEDLNTALADHDGRIDAHDERLGELERRVDELSAQLAGVLEELEVEPYDPEALTNIRGIGSAYATRLGEADVDTISKLLETSVEALVAATEVSERRAEEWKHRAETHAERELAASASAAEREVDEE